jgi:hypothetical protein
MSKTLLTLSFFLVTHLHSGYFSSKNADPIYYASHPHSLILLKYGADSFIDLVQDDSAKSFMVILYDIQKNASVNGIDAEAILTSISAELTQRIDRIKRIAHKGVDTTMIGYGISASSIGATIAYLFKRVHAHYKDNGTLLQALQKSITDKGINITYTSGYLSLINPKNIQIPNDAYTCIEAYRERTNLRQNLVYAGILSLMCLGCGIYMIYQGMNPHYDDKYLEKYEELLSITNTVSTKCAIEE